MKHNIPEFTAPVNIDKLKTRKQLINDVYDMTTLEEEILFLTSGRYIT